jgi:hypothetical protein
MPFFIKKPIKVEAIQFFDNVKEIESFVGKELLGNMNGTEQVQELYISTLEGEMIATRKDWIIKGIKGEFYPCKPDIFEKSYNSSDGNVLVIEIDGKGSFNIEKEVYDLFLLTSKERDYYRDIFNKV